MGAPDAVAEQLQREVSADLRRTFQAGRRLTLAELAQHQVAVREGITALEKQPTTAYRHHVEEAVNAIGCELSKLQGRPAVFFTEDRDLFEFIAEVSVCFAQFETRVWRSALNAMRVDMGRHVVWFEVETYDNGEYEGGLG